MSTTTRLYVYSITVAGLLMIAYGVGTWHSSNPAMLAVYLILTVLASSLKISLPGVTGTMSVWFLFILIGFTEMSLAETLLLSSSATIVQCFWRAKQRPKRIQILFNIGAAALATGVGFGVYHGSLWARIGVGFPLPLGIAAIVFFLCNTTPIAVVIGLTEGKPPWNVWKQSYLWCFPYYFAGASLAAAVSVVTRHFGWEVAPMTLPVIVIIFRTYKGYFDSLRIQKEHAESVARLAAIVESADAAIVSEDTNGIVLTWNRGAERIFGYSSDEMLGRRLSILVPEDRRQEDEANMERLRQGATVDHVETTRLTKSGSLIHLLITISPIRDFAGRVCGMAHVGWDITLMKRLESQLSQAQKLESIGQLAAGVAHEINTPIQYIGDNTRFLETAFGDLVKLAAMPRETPIRPNRPASGEQEEADNILSYLQNEIPSAIAHMNEGIDQVARIVRAMKEFSHPGAVEKVPVDVNRAIESTVLVSRNEWKYVADLTTALARDLPLIPAVSGELNQVILNLIVNAAHAIGDVVRNSDKKGLIHISTSRNDRFIEIRVRDTGCGIPESVRARVFDPFFTTKPVDKGTGQGLAIAHSVVVQKHRGSIRLESEVGHGTTFIIQLPLVADPASQIDSAATDSGRSQLDVANSAPVPAQF